MDVTRLRDRVLAQQVFLGHIQPGAGMRPFGDHDERGFALAGDVGLATGRRFGEGCLGGLRQATRVPVGLAVERSADRDH